jgi:alpha-mannosidase
LICLNSGLTVAAPDNTGMGLCPIDSPCVSLGEPGLWKYSFDYVPKRATVFVNLYNNEWNTNFPEWQDGSWVSRVQLWPIRGTDEARNLVVPSWEARLPLLAAVADGPAGKLPKEQAGLSVSRPGVLVTAFGPNPDGQGTLLRAWDQTGVSGEVVVTLPARYKTATPVTLRGENAGEPVTLRGQKLAFRLPAYAPASYLLE